jgi:hypothetical protein
MPGGPTYNVTASGGGSGEPVTFAIDSTSSAVCSLSGSSTVSFKALGTCTIDAHEAGNANYEAALEAKQSLTVAHTQTIHFTSTAPTNATVGGASYTVAATASSGLPVTFSSGAPAVCSVSGATVSFTGAGTCTIDAHQAGNAEYHAAPQVQQSFAVAAKPAPAEVLKGPPGPVLPTPNSGFSDLSVTVDPKTGAITFTESVANAGTFSLLATFQNGKFGVFSARASKCKAGFARFGGKCRPRRIMFANGTRPAAAPGDVTFTIKPSRSALSALKRALKRKRGVPVTVTLTFQSALGGSPSSRTNSLTVKLRKKK